MAIGITINSQTFIGSDANITFTACTGGRYDLGTQTIPYTYINPFYEGTYSISIPEFQKVCELDISCSGYTNLIYTFYFDTSANEIYIATSESMDLTLTNLPGTYSNDSYVYLSPTCYSPLLDLLVLGNCADGKVYYADRSDLSTWYEASLPSGSPTSAGDAYYRAAWIEELGRFYISTANGLMTSLNGKGWSWVNNIPNGSSAYGDFGYDNVNNILYGYAYSDIGNNWYSTDGLNFTSSAKPISYDAYGFLYNENSNRTYTFEYGGKRTQYTDDNGLNWVTGNSITGTYTASTFDWATSVAYGNGISLVRLAGGDSLTLPNNSLAYAYSNDGINFQYVDITSGSINDTKIIQLYFSSFANKFYMVTNSIVGTKNYLLSSTDGLNWSILGSETSGSNYYFGLGEIIYK